LGAQAGRVDAGDSDGEGDHGFPASDPVDKGDGVRRGDREGDLGLPPVDLGIGELVAQPRRGTAQWFPGHHTPPGRIQPRRGGAERLVP
jgi:hypothetical protein